MNENSPIIEKIYINDENIIKFKENPRFDNIINLPKFNLGFHHFLHANKEKTSILNEFKGKKKVYLVANNYEINIDDYNEGINDVARIYFELNEKQNIINRSFYKLWEIYILFSDIINTKKAINTAHIAEGPGSFIQATSLYRKKFCKKYYKDDKYFGITIHDEINDFNELFIKQHNKIVDNITIHKTHNITNDKIKINKDNGDITNLITINNFYNTIKSKNVSKIDLITADGGFEWKNENTQEQELYSLLISEIIIALKIQKNGGNFICKIYELFTNITMKLLCILSQLYSNIYIIKPFTSRLSNSEKYIVCCGFNEKKIEQYVQKLENILTMINNNPNLFLCEIFPEFNLSEKFTESIIDVNVLLSNLQYKKINQIITFINDNNFHGKQYVEYKEKQIDCSKKWIQKFFI
jgi:23S rRNA U2552 (ribose-2'-O)-methylase RlmE/FtsJ